MVAVKVQSSRLASVKQEYAAFQATTKALGDAQIAKNKLKDAEDKALKEQLNAKNQEVKRLSADNLRRMRESSSSSSELPAVPAGSKRPDLACFDRAEYQREDGIVTAKLLAGARSLADEGTTCAIDLDTGKDWVKGQAVK